MKLLISDYDDTFYTSDVNIRINMKYVEKFMKNNLFVIATGRSNTDYNVVKKKYGIKSNYIILNHGAEIKKDDRVIYKKYINRKILENLFNDLNLKSTIRYSCYSDLNMTRNIHTFKNITKINVRYNSREESSKYQRIILDKYGEYINAHLVCENEVAIEIVSKEASKENAIEYIACTQNIKNENIYVIGDSYSDVEMIKEYNGFVMQNSIAEGILGKKYSKKYSNVYELINDIERGKV